MGRYRIRRLYLPVGERYEVQRRSIFGFWYNPEGCGVDSFGLFKTFKEAKGYIENSNRKVKPQVVFDTDWIWH